ncbi:conserved protein of unknown function [Ralstonia solanacearum CMR15]|nr:conserved protein of unknown function [Ralstonia solanacearum CMR15]
MVNAITPFEKMVCDVIVDDPHYCSNEGHDPHSYMEPVARAMLRGDLNDAAMASLGRELVQQFLRDIRSAVAEEEAHADALIAEEEAGERAARRLGMSGHAIA